MLKLCKLQKKLNMKKFLLLFMGIISLSISCSKDDDIGVDGPDSTSVSVQDFMWKAMNIWYFWQSDVADLADDRFSTNEEYNAFLVSESDPADCVNATTGAGLDPWRIFHPSTRQPSGSGTGLRR